MVIPGHLNKIWSIVKPPRVDGFSSNQVSPTAQLTTSGRVNRCAGGASQTGVVGTFDRGPNGLEIFEHLYGPNDVEDESGTVRTANEQVFISGNTRSLKRLPVRELF